MTRSLGNVVYNVFKKLLSKDQDIFPKLKILKASCIWHSNKAPQLNFGMSKPANIVCKHAGKKINKLGGKDLKQSSICGRVEEQREEVGGVGKIDNKSQRCSTSKDQ